jgi:hypothetical protein
MLKVRHVPGFSNVSNGQLSPPFAISDAPQFAISDAIQLASVHLVLVDPHNPFQEFCLCNIA